MFGKAEHPMNAFQGDILRDKDEIDDFGRDVVFKQIKVMCFRDEFEIDSSRVVFHPTWMSSPARLALSHEWAYKIIYGDDKERKYKSSNSFTVLILMDTTM